MTNHHSFDPDNTCILKQLPIFIFTYFVATSSLLYNSRGYIKDDILTEILNDWILKICVPEWKCYIKRLSANDTGQTGGHQVGVYFPKEVLAGVFPSLNSVAEPNPEYKFNAQVISHSLPQQELRAIYYNSKFHGKTRNEKRITRWNSDVKQSPLQNGENTGAITIFAFHQPISSQNAIALEVWVCDNLGEENLIESQIGEVLPGDSRFGQADKLFGGMATYSLGKVFRLEIPSLWYSVFPTGIDIIAHVENTLQYKSKNPDELLLKRREAEFSVFKKVEEIHVLDQIKEGFSTVDEFIQLANSISNRRKSRSGKSLELHLESIFKAFGINDYSAQCVTEGNKKPDFIFPSCTAYHNPKISDDILTMLAVKTTCKDRWTQIINEANRIKTKYLFTLQEGVSINQFKEMEAENVKLVVPKPLHKNYPKEIRNYLFTLQDFIDLLNSKKI